MPSRNGDGNTSAEDERETAAIDQEIKDFSTLAQYETARLHIAVLRARRAERTKRVAASRPPKPAKRRERDQVHEEIEEILSTPDDEYEETFHMTREDMRSVLELVEEDPVFRSEGDTPQVPVKYQLAVFAYKMAHGGSDGTVGKKFHVSLRDWVDRSILALTSRLPRIISWPDWSDRAIAKKEINDTFGLPECVGFIGTTHFILNAAPDTDSGAESEPSSSSSSSYLTLLAVADIGKRFTYLFYSQGTEPEYPRSMQYETGLEKRRTDFLLQREYVLGGEGFVSTTSVMSMFPDDGELGGREIHFNKQVSEALQSIQHAIAIVRARWRALDILRPMLTPQHDKTEEARAHGMILAAFCLHNLTISSWETFVSEEMIQEEMDEAERYRVEDPEPDVDRTRLRNGKYGLARREKLVDKLMSSQEPVARHE